MSLSSRYRHQIMVIAKNSERVTKTANATKNSSDIEGVFVWIVMSSDYRLNVF